MASSEDNNVSSSDDYIDKLKKTIPGDLTAIYLSFRMVVGNVYGFDAKASNQQMDIQVIVIYVKYLLLFMVPLSLLGAAYLFLVSKINSWVQVAVILISYLLWMISLDIGFYSAALNVGQKSLGFWFVDAIIGDKLLFIGITLLWTFSIPIIYSAATRMGLIK